MAPSNKLEKMQAAINVTPMRAILDGEKKKWSLVNVAGTAVDFQSPIATRGTDWKCTMRLLDKSTEDSKEDAMSVFIFRDKDSMPQLRFGDVVFILQAKVQMRDFEPPSLLTNHNTTIRLYEGSQIPRPPKPAEADLSRSTFPKGFNGTRTPSKAEAEYVSQLHHCLDKTSLPSNQEWEVHVISSQAVRDKFSELDKIEPGSFYDFVAQVIRWHDIGDKITLWVSDYTENEQFFNHSFLSGHLSEVQDGDPYGYGAKFTKSKKLDKEPSWEGPFGKRSIQVTCWDDHANAIRENKISSGDWVMLKNVQVKYGNNGANLEGFLREDKLRSGAAKVNITQLDPTDDQETMDPRLKSAIRRKRDYERSRKKELKEVEEAAAAGQKRKAAIAFNSKSKQKMRRNLARKKKQDQNGEMKEKDEKDDTDHDGDASRQTSPEMTATPTDLNQHVKCEHHTIRPSTISDILKPLHHKIEIDGEDTLVPLPFANLNYRANVRVTDFYPSDLRAFSIATKASEFDVLSDNEDSDYASESDDSPSQPSNRVWEWRFFLELEDASGGKGERVWVVVDNQSAQYLTNLDASDLKDDEKALETLQERLFILWGNLAEQKAASESAAVSKRARRTIRADGPPPDSSDVEDEGGESTAKVMNRPFPCCIRQYGIKVRESDPDRADAGEGFRWERVYGLFGTRIFAA